MNGIIIENNENQKLIRENRMKNKKRLINIFERLKVELEDDNMETVSEVYGYISNEENELNKEKRENINKCCKCFMIEIIIVISSVLYIMGILSIIPIKDSISNLLITSIESKLDIFCDKEKFKKQTNFFDYFSDEPKKAFIKFKFIDVLELYWHQMLKFIMIHYNIYFFFNIKCNNAFFNIYF